jgi:hypothetical protein
MSNFTKSSTDTLNISYIDQRSNLMSNAIDFEDTLEDDDWGLIISASGELKGLFIPDGKQEEDVPETIVNMCVRVFGIDVTAHQIENTVH